MGVWYFLDDERLPPQKPGVEWVVYRNPDVMLRDIVKHGLPDGISFDHDLGSGVMTGHDVAKKILEFMLDGVVEPKEFEYEIHSQNPVGAKNIEGVMQSINRYIEMVKAGRI